ncbi:MAG: tetratricopeptide repeat protein [Gaiellaceae bacterium]
MTVVEPLTPFDAGPRADEGRRLNVVRLVDSLGPISPELVLIDPQLAAHARALLPDYGTTTPPEATVQPRRLALPAPAPWTTASSRRTIPWRLLGACAAFGAAASIGFGAWTTVSGNDPVVAPQPSAETEASPTFFSTPPVEPDLTLEAIAALEEDVRHAPRSALAREALGSAYVRLERWEDAEVEFRALVELSPEDDFAHYALGRALVEQGRQWEAARQFEKAGSLAQGGATAPAP